MPGTRSQPGNICDSCQGYSSSAVTGGQILFEYVANAFQRITGVKFLAVTAGSGAGNTVGDVLLNGTSIWSNAANKPTLLGTATGEFNNSRPDPNAQNLRPGDRLTLQIASIPATTGHARVTSNITFEANA